MSRIEYRDPSPFYCGTCGDQLVFQIINWPIPGAWYVHETDLRSRCYGRRFTGPHSASEPLVNPTRRPKIRQLDDRAEALEHRVAQLEQATHDHCLHCGAMTPRHGMTHCGRANCEPR